MLHKLYTRCGNKVLWVIITRWRWRHNCVVVIVCKCAHSGIRHVKPRPQTNVHPSIATGVQCALHSCSLFCSLLLWLLLYVGNAFRIIFYFFEIYLMVFISTVECADRIWIKYPLLILHCIAISGMRHGNECGIIIIEIRVSFIILTDFRSDIAAGWIQTDDLRMHEHREMHWVEMCAVLHCPRWMHKATHTLTVHSTAQRSTHIIYLINFFLFISFRANETHAKTLRALGNCSRNGCDQDN